MIFNTVYYKQRYSGIVQSVEQRTVNPYVTGSSPVARAKNFPVFRDFLLLFSGNLFLYKTHKNVKKVSKMDIFTPFFIQNHTESHRNWRTDFYIDIYVIS